MAQKREHSERLFTLKRQAMKTCTFLKFLYHALFQCHAVAANPNEKAPKDAKKLPIVIMASTTAPHSTVIYPEGHVPENLSKSDVRRVHHDRHLRIHHHQRICRFHAENPRNSAQYDTHDRLVSFLWVVFPRILWVFNSMPTKPTVGDVMLRSVYPSESQLFLQHEYVACIVMLFLRTYARLHTKKCWY